MEKLASVLSNIIPGEAPQPREEFTPEQIADIKAKREKEADEMEKMKLAKVMERVANDVRRQERIFPDLSIKAIYDRHVKILIEIANMICLRGQRRTLEIDEYNKKILRFLLYYFNNCPLAETVFEDKDYKLEKNLLIMGKVGTGKTLLMQIFSEYLRYTNNPNFFHNVSVTEMVNYYTIHNNLDRYTYNEENSTGFKPSPVNICLNDIGVDNGKHFGQDTKIMTTNFLHARNEIWTASAPDIRKFTHLTTNLDKKQLEKEYEDGFGRLTDRFKTYNIIALKGTSRR